LEGEDQEALETAVTPEQKGKGKATSPGVGVNNTGSRSTASKRTADASLDEPRHPVRSRRRMMTSQRM
jgi:hypothetical protein